MKQLSTSYFDDYGDADDHDDGGSDNNEDEYDDEPCFSQTHVVTPSSQLCRH